MPTEISITPEEHEIIDGVAGKFISRMKWNPQCEFEDVRQELMLFWLKKKQDGWQRPEVWKGAMGQCLILHLKDLQKKDCARNRRTKGPILSLGELMEQGFDLPVPAPQTPLDDFLGLLNSQERRICDLLMQGKSKKEIAQILHLSRPSLDQRLKHVRHLAEEYL